jgi:hypothetical protein
MAVNDGAAFASYRPGMHEEGAVVNIGTTKSRLAAIAAIAALGLVATFGGAVTGDASAVSASGTLSSDTPVPFRPHETGALAGTSETYVDIREDGSYYDPSLGRRVSPRPFWPHETGALGGTSETYVDMREDGFYYDPSLGQRVSAR